MGKLKIKDDIDNFYVIIYNNNCTGLFRKEGIQ